MSTINIVGAGLAGLSAAVTAAQSGVCCRLISALPSERAQSVMAEGGINAALDTMGENDTVEEHYRDTIRGGVDLADPNAVWGLCSHAPEIVERLCRIGAALLHQNGQPVLRAFGGQKKKRTAFAQSSTGKILMTAMTDLVRKYEAEGKITRYAHHEFLSIAIEDGHCTGVTAADLYRKSTVFFPGPVIIATGGMNSLFPGLTTGTTVNTGDVTAKLFAQGVRLANLEFIQYHPTTMALPRKRCLVSEAARGEGGRLFVERQGERWYFMEEKYPELKNLMPRDVVSREIWNVTHLPECGDQVYLDMTGIGENVWRQKLADLREECIRCQSRDPAAEPVAVSPGIHYFMGGIDTAVDHSASIPGLFAAGECACQYHGANRLGGNSMLGALYGGSVAAHSAAEALTQSVYQRQGEIEDGREAFSSAILEQDHTVSAEIGHLLQNALGIYRTEATLNNAVEELNRHLEKTATQRAENRLLLAKAVLLSAANRRESRGAHSRTDYPERNDKDYRKTSLALRKGRDIQIELREIPQQRSEVK